MSFCVAFHSLGKSGWLFEYSRPQPWKSQVVKCTICRMHLCLLFSAILLRFLSARLVALASPRQSSFNQNERICANAAVVGTCQLNMFRGFFVFIGTEQCHFEALIPCHGRVFLS